MRLIDSNIIIYATYPAAGKLREIINHPDSHVSVISKIEVLGFTRLNELERELFHQFFQNISVLPLSDEVAQKAIELRSKKKMTLGDAIIGATAMVHGFELITHNTADFRLIKGIRLHDPI